MRDRSGAWRTPLVVLALVAVTAGHARAPEKQKLSIEWMFGKGPETIAAVSNFAWLSDGSLLLCDVRKPEEERTWELLDPATGVSRPALDMEKAMTQLKSLVGDAPTALPWPVAFDPPGRHALLTFGKELCVLDRASSQFQLVTKLEAGERTATLSPDGRRVAFVRNNNLVVYDLQSKNEKQLTHDGSETLLNGTLSWVYWEEIFGRHDTACWWSDDSKCLAFLQTDDSRVATTTFTDFQPYQPRVFTQRYPKAGQPNPRVRVGIADIESGKITWVRLPADYEYVLRVNWLPASNRVSVQTMNRAQTEVDLFMADRATGSISRILKETDDSWVHIYDPYFLKNRKEFLWISDRSGYAHIYRYTLEGRLINQMTRGDWPLRPFGAFAINDSPAILSVDEKEGWVYFTAGEKSTIERHLYSVRLDGTGMKRLSREDGYHNPQFSRDGRYYLDTYSSVSMPPSLTLHTADGTRLKLITPSYPVAPLDMQYPSFFTIPAEDGFRMPAQISRPKDFDPNRKYPVVIYVYGGPGSPSVSNSWNINDWSESIYFDQMLLRNGYLVVSVDNRSSACISKTMEKSIRGQMYGDVELHDLLAAVKWIKFQPFVDPGRVGIWGWSGGGMYTLLAMTRSEEFKAGISVAPVTDWRYYDAKWTELTMKRPEDNPDGYEKTSLVKRAANLHGRLLLVYGTFDDNVHPQNSQAFINELILAGKIFELMTYPMRKHQIDDPPARIHLFKTMLEFWKRNL
jgi:dipeptidyl-peptidase 4